MAARAKIANNKQLEIDATEIRIRAGRRLGAMLAEQKKTVGLAKRGTTFHKGEGPWLDVHRAAHPDRWTG